MAVEAISGFNKALIRGNQLAIGLAKTCLTTPVLINKDSTQGAVYAVPLMVETNQKSASAEVSESLIISTDSKKNITDNVAPGGLSWHLSGYIIGDPTGLTEPTNYFQPLMNFNVDTLWSWFNHAAVLTYKDGNAQFYKRVVIKDLQTGMQKDAQDATPFTMTLKEITVMETPNDIDADSNVPTKDEIKSMPDKGSAGGSAATMGSVSAEVVE